MAKSTVVQCIPATLQTRLSLIDKVNFARKVWVLY